MNRAVIKGMHYADLVKQDAGGLRVKQEQEEISLNLIQALFAGLVLCNEGLLHLRIMLERSDRHDGCLCRSCDEGQRWVIIKSLLESRHTTSIRLA